jgi:RNA recognition motif-containing protein
MSFESIFSNKQNVDPNLDALFKNKKATNLTSDTIVKLIDGETTKPVENELQSGSMEKPKISRRKGAKIKHERDEEQESRTIFVGNLPNNTKKEVLVLSLTLKLQLCLFS